MDIIKTITDRVQGKALKGEKRSSDWTKVRKKFLVEHPKCFICGSNNKIEVHHKVPFNLAPDLELNPDNLISLCENKKYGINCHLLVGHLGNYKRFNPNIMIDATTWKLKLTGG